jgi:hypothetical protein
MLGIMLIILVYLDIIKVSTALLINVVLEYIFVYLLYNNKITSSLFTIQHEDYILVIELMAFFIVKAIENIK